MTMYWNGQPVDAKECTVIVGYSPRPTWWCAKLAGTKRKAIKITAAFGEPFYIDNEDGSGMRKVTVGKGSPTYGHRSLPVAKEVDVD